MTEDVLECLRWWREWRDFGILPFGNRDLSREPAIVFDVIVVCQRARADAPGTADA